MLHDQSMLDAELFMEALDGRIQEGWFDRPLVFLCHASEDQLFVDWTAS
jgi:hypothetical protein